MFNRIKLAAALMAAVFLALGVPAAAAEPKPIAQTEWAGLKKRLTLPNGISLAYVELGDPQGPPLLLLHGYTDSSRSWILLAPHLDRFRLIIPDQRGHGASDAPACCYGPTQMAEDARQLLDALKIDRAVVAGHSMGSMVAMTLASEHPSRVERIVLLGSTVMVPVRRGDWLWENVEALKWPLDPTTEFLREWHPGNQPTPVEASFAKAAMDDILSVKPHVWRSVLRELADLPVGRHAADVRAPVLILSGGKDPLFPPEHHQAMLKAFPTARAKVYPALGHNLLWEQPVEIAREIDSFVGE